MPLPDEDSAQGVADASGICEIRFGPVTVGHAWMLQRAVVQSDSALESELFIYADNAQNLQQREHTFSGNGDVADEFSPLKFDGGIHLLFRWIGCTPGANCWAWIQYEVVTI